MPTFQTHDGLTLWYEDEGQGVPVLCLAGLTRNARDFDRLAAHLTEVRLIRLDSRGRGRSDHDPDFTHYNVPQEAADAVALLDHLGLEKAVIVGTSRGGLLAMTIGATAPDRLAGVVLNDVGPVIEADAIGRIMEYVGRPPKARTMEEAVAGTKAALGPQFPTLTDADWQQVTEAQYEVTPDGLRLRYDLHLRDALLAQAKAGLPPDLWPLFDALPDVPLGLLRGGNSDLLTPQTVAAMQARRPAMFVAEVPDRGHVPLLDEPESLSVIRKVLSAI